jgi:hypothetical protein
MARGATRRARRRDRSTPHRSTCPLTYLDRLQAAERGLYRCTCAYDVALLAAGAARQRALGYGVDEEPPARYRCSGCGSRSPRRRSPLDERLDCACGKRLDENGEHDGGYGAWCG